MHITEQNKKALVKEIEEVSKMMAGTEIPIQKLYYFSAIFGIANRILNVQYDSELGLIHMVLKTAHSAINAALPTIGPNQSIPDFPPRFFENLDQTVIDLGKAITSNNSVYPTLEKISDLTYSTTGNGYYLFLKGALKI